MWVLFRSINLSRSQPLGLTIILFTPGRLDDYPPVWRKHVIASHTMRGTEPLDRKLNWGRPPTVTPLRMGVNSMAWETLNVISISKKVVEVAGYTSRAWYVGIIALSSITCWRPWTSK